jgi:RimJ/RimL family protein N-acetyltransferase
METDDHCDVVIRRGTPEDLESFQRCLDAVARERKWLAFLEAPPIEAVRDFVLRNAPIQFVAVRHGEVVGWCDVTPSQRDGFRHSGTLGMGLLPGFRSRGFGRKLLQETIDAAHEVGLTRIELEVLAANQPATRLYERLGFNHEGRKRGARLLDGQPEDILCMALVTPSGGAPANKPLQPPRAAQPNGQREPEGGGPLG